MNRGDFLAEIKRRGYGWMLIDQTVTDGSIPPFVMVSLTTPDGLCQLRLKGPSFATLLNFLPDIKTLPPLTWDVTYGI